MDFFLRHASRLDTLPNRTPVRAYDARFLFILCGKGELHLSERTIPLSENSLCYYPAGTQYFPCSSPSAPMSVITVNFDFTRAHTDRIRSYHPIPISAPFDMRELKATHLDFPHERFQEAFVLENASHLRESFVKLERESGSSLPFARERAEAILTYIIYDILAEREKKENTLIHTLCEYLDEHYRTVNSNEAVANALNYHESYLNKVMREYMGTTLHQYINLKRLEEAEFLLLYSDESIEEISERVGFANTKHFSTLFRRRTGTSPSHYRKRGKWI